MRNEQVHLPHKIWIKACFVWPRFLMWLQWDCINKAPIARTDCRIMISISGTYPILQAGSLPGFVREHLEHSKTCYLEDKVSSPLCLDTDESFSFSQLSLTFLMKFWTSNQVNCGLANNESMVVFHITEKIVILKTNEVKLCVFKGSSNSSNKDPQNSHFRKQNPSLHTRLCSPGPGFPIG